MVKLGRDWVWFIKMKEKPEIRLIVIKMTRRKLKTHFLIVYGTYSEDP